MRSALPAVAAAALLVLAGCSGAAPDPSPNPGPDDTVTTTESASPPGVTDGELTDPRVLVRAHAASVRERGARVVSNATATVDAGNETRTLSFSASAWATPDQARVYSRSERLVGVLSGSTRRERVFRYANETSVVVRQVVEGNETVEVESRTDTRDLARNYVARAPFLQSRLNAAPFRVTDTERRNGRTVTTLVADERTLDADGRSVFDATLRVTGEGRILSLTIRRNPNADTDAGRRTYEATWTAAPEDTERPAWAP